jgi:hypothetical protein
MSSNSTLTHASLEEMVKRALEHEQAESAIEQAKEQEKHSSEVVAKLQEVIVAWQDEFPEDFRKAFPGTFGEHPIPLDDGDPIQIVGLRFSYQGTTMVLCPEWTRNGDRRMGCWQLFVKGDEASDLWMPQDERDRDAARAGLRDKLLLTIHSRWQREQSERSAAARAQELMVKEGATYDRTDFVHSVRSSEFAETYHELRAHGFRIEHIFMEPGEPGYTPDYMIVATKRPDELHLKLERLATSIDRASNRM